MRRASLFNTDRTRPSLSRSARRGRALLALHYGDLTDGASLRRLLGEVDPDEVYNLGAQSHVMVSFEMPEYTADVDALGTLRLLESLRDDHVTRDATSGSLLPGRLRPRCSARRRRRRMS